MSEPGDTLNVQPLPDYPEMIGLDLWRLEDARVRTLSAVKGLTQTQLEAQTSSGNTVSTLLYHLAAIEADWLYAEVVQEDFPEDILAYFPTDVRDETGRLSRMTGEGLETHLERLGFVRTRLLGRFTAMDETEYRQLRHLPDYDVSPQWVLHHLAQHEALHRGQILAALNHSG